jgi:hypothetical protein
VREGFQILSAYTTRKGVKLWIIKKSDHSATTMLLPDEILNHRYFPSKRTHQLNDE